MEALAEMILNLTDTQAIRAALYLGASAQRHLDEGEMQELGPEVTEDQAMDILQQALPAVGNVGLESLSADAPKSAHAVISRNLLVMLAEDDRNTQAIRDAVDHAQVAVVSELVLAAAVLFVLTTNFRIERKVVDGKARTTWSVSRKASSTQQLKLIFHPTEALQKFAGIFTKTRDS